jgi:hypothetical protein
MIHTSLTAAGEVRRLQRLAEAPRDWYEPRPPETPPEPVAARPRRALRAIVARVAAQPAAAPAALGNDWLARQAEGANPRHAPPPHFGRDPGLGASRGPAGG